MVGLSGVDVVGLSDSESHRGLDEKSQLLRTGVSPSQMLPVSQVDLKDDQITLQTTIKKSVESMRIIGVQGTTLSTQNTSPIQEHG